MEKPKQIDFYPEALAKRWFDIDLTPTQSKIMRDILLERKKRIIITAMTRYGKSLIVALSALFYVLFNNDKKVAIIAPSYKQARILMDYIAKFIVTEPMVGQEIDMDVTGIERLKREVTKERITFKNGSEIRILSAEGKGERLLGFGADLVVIDESAWVSDLVYTGRILRMLGDTPDKAMLVEIGNPFGRNHFWYDWNNDKFKRYHIDWKLALKEGRTTKEFIDEMREQLNEIEFKILYDADFTEAEGVFIPMKLIEPVATLKPREKQEGYDYYLGVDIARYGTDETAYVVVGTKDYERWEMFYYETTGKKPLTDVVGRVINLNKKWNFNKIIIDETGLGSGPVDELKEKGLPIEGVVFTSKARNELYNTLKWLFEKQKVYILKDNKLISQINSYTFEYNSAGNLKIIKQEMAHDDISDALALALKYGRGGTFAFAKYKRW